MIRFVDFGHQLDPDGPRMFGFWHGVDDLPLHARVHRCELPRGLGLLGVVREGPCRGLREQHAHIGRRRWRKT